ncbi:hydrogenase expression/formation protein [Nitrospirillum viridazoti]|uniref:Hydrogenase expression/formation protein n=1 Tax=Nitrospirillum viridazoti CBAmc TaxID=1441467 RepID=A0A248JVW5_9PROT|nr:hydrogenase expression/formation protein [Nitrospirillum amazonense]ASG22364.1 hydrogenase expression/formation protein [Nitrospirillum amazonense CBAmc]TWB43105.1 hydrogenase-1 operon protein HyaF [Nitrospirillum amazonense]
MNDAHGGALVGPGSQPGDFDGGRLDYMVMPDGMAIFSAANVPEADEAQAVPQGVAAGDAILAALIRVVAGARPQQVDLTHLDAANLAFVDQLLGEGEVSVMFGTDVQAQESVLAGVWRVRESNAAGRRLRDYVDCAPFPAGLAERAFNGARGAAVLPETARPNIFNAPPLIAEINEHIPRVGEAGGAGHVINLSLLPHTEEDLAFLDEALGRGGLVILSRGYGNCRIRSTGTRGCWWTQYFNSQDTLILNSIEICAIPRVALAAAEDLADSAERLREIMEIYR